MTTDLDHAESELDNWRKCHAPDCLSNALAAIIRHLRNSPADGKAERGEGVAPSTLYKIYNDAYWRAVQDFPHPAYGLDNLADTRRHTGYLALYDAGFRAGQQSRIDERERAVLVAARRYVRGGQLGGVLHLYDALAEAVNDLDSAAHLGEQP